MAKSRENEELKRKRAEYLQYKELNTPKAFIFTISDENKFVELQHCGGSKHVRTFGKGARSGIIGQESDGGRVMLKETKSCITKVKMHGHIRREWAKSGKGQSTVTELMSRLFFS